MVREEERLSTSLKPGDGGARIETDTKTHGTE